MVPELGLFSLILALVLALIVVARPLFSFRKYYLYLQQSVAQSDFNLPQLQNRLLKTLILGQTFFVILSFICLSYAFVTNDFSVRYVVMHSHSALPSIYKLAAVWGGHEGSILLWIVFLCLWMTAFVYGSKFMPKILFNRSLCLLSLINLGFLIFLLFSSNPFIRLLPYFPFEGQDLNPLLQDPGLVFHPPLLYFGYVGLALPFALAVSALTENPVNFAWAKFARPWTLAAFAFLTGGIVWGSYWAYYELGWGGYWFWDPVENVSLMPWLIALALIHSLIINDKQKRFQSFSVLLAILAFALSLLGTFLVRSGILSSVHNFASDPKRGLYILILSFILIGGALGLYAKRGSALLNQNNEVAALKPYARETLMLIAGLLWMIASLSILLGTLYPLFYESITDQKISVGFPYFNWVFVALMIPVLILVPFGPFAKWQNNSAKALIKHLRVDVVVSFIVGLATLGFTHKLGYALCVVLVVWLCLGTALRAYHKIKGSGLKSISLSGWGMLVAHFGAGVIVMGVATVSYYEIEREVVLHPGQVVNLAGTALHFKGVTSVEGQNTLSYQARFALGDGKDNENNQNTRYLLPEKRQFIASGNIMTETAIDAGFFRDIHIALGERLDKDSWHVRIYYKPLVRWIWWGALMMALGAILSLIAKFRKRV